jgi:hypothetical protein
LPGYLTRLAARFVHSTTLIDRAYQRFDRLRSLLVLAVASDSFLDAHCKLAYDALTAYQADSPDFRRELFQWERLAVRNFFPAPPARVLLGGAGGGREAYGLCEMGYRVVAFDPAPVLAASMRKRAEAEWAALLETYCASYQDLPIMPATSGSQLVDLRTQAPFDAAILGWVSFSHIVQDSARVSALKAFGELTRGPILVSYYSDAARTGPARGAGGRLRALRRRAARRGTSMFTTGVGYVRLFSDADLRDVVERAGLEVVHIDNDHAFPYAILRRRTAVFTSS